MSKKLLLIIAALSSFGVFAASPQEGRFDTQYDTSLFCNHADKLYSLGALVEVSGNIVQCKPAANTSYDSTDIETAHWELLIK